MEGLREEGIQSASHLLRLIAEVERRRQVRDTRMNQSSSRSHLIVRITVESRPSDGAQQQRQQQQGEEEEEEEEEAGVVVVSTLNFVDLAGSERVQQAAGGGLVGASGAAASPAQVGASAGGCGGEGEAAERERVRQKEVSCCRCPGAVGPANGPRAERARRAALLAVPGVRTIAPCRLATSTAACSRWAPSSGRWRQSPGCVCAVVAACIAGERSRL